MGADPPSMPPASATPVAAGELNSAVVRILDGLPAVGLAVGVICGGALTWFHGYGVADIESGAPVDEDTVFRIASVTKTMTAIAVMQLCELGLVDLDAPASDYLRAYRLIPAKARFRPATLRHLLTHTAGVRAARTAADLFRPVMGWGVPAGRPVPSLAEYYRDGLHIDVEPGTRWAYSNHGFATVGQIVEDVSGLPFGRYLAERIFGPLGMDSTDLTRSARVRARVATGYQMRSAGPVPVRDYENIPAGGGSVYSTTRDMTRYAAALLGGGTGAHGQVLRPQTVARMFQPHYQPDPRIPGMGLGFFRDEIAGHRTVGHDGIWTGFHAALLLAPDDGTGVVALANTGPFNPVAAPGPVVHAVLRSLLGLPDDAVRTDLPPQPQVWRELCGWYTLGPGVLTDPQPRMLLAAGAEVAVHRGQLVIRGQLPIPAVRRGLRLHPDGDDPYAFRIQLPPVGSGTSRIVFSRGPGGDVTALHLDTYPMTLHKRPAVRNPRPWINGALAAGATALAVRHRARARHGARKG
ncbi:MAG TPA: serine hydrolase domain-containing protein [Streptosporangiaceae bacterium]|nr:serine hydrolase domain-containing protein [Streptosporangiaceae bacterium]